MPASQGGPLETLSLQLQNQTEWICTRIKTKINQKSPWKYPRNPFSRFLYVCFSSLTSERKSGFESTDLSQEWVPERDWHDGSPQWNHMRPARAWVKKDSPFWTENHKLPILSEQAALRWRLSDQEKWTERRTHSWHFSQQLKCQKDV